jgi:hypothetical protein
MLRITPYNVRQKRISSSWKPIQLAVQIHESSSTAHIVHGYTDEQLSTPAHLVLA